MEDEEIVALYFNRDENAIRQTDQKYGKSLLRFAFRLLGVYEEAEECRNDTYWKTWNAIPPAKPEYLYGFLMRICRFTAYNRLEQSNAKKRKSVVVELTAELEECICGARDACSELEERELAASVNAFLKGQEQWRRELFLRRYWYGDNIRQIAKRCGISQSKVKTELFRLRQRLRNYLEKEGYL